MKTLQQAHSTDACYFGDRPDWLIVFSVNRDSSTLDRANWQSFVDALGGESDTVAIERSSHWACGWVDYLVIDPAASDLIVRAKELHSSFEEYPVLDEEALSKLEWEEYQESWSSWGRRDYVQAVCKRIHSEYRDGISEDFSDDDVLDAIRELPDEAIDKAAGDSSPNWEYQAEGDGVTINIEGMASTTDLDQLIDPAIESLRQQRKADEITKLSQLLGACPAEQCLAVRQGLVFVTHIQQLMQGGI